MNKLASILIVTGILLSLLGATLVLSYKPATNTNELSDDFNGQVLSTDWGVEDIESKYTLSNGLLTLSSDAGANTGIALYRDFNPQTDGFTVSSRVKASTLDFVALRIQFKSLPIILPNAAVTAATLQVRPDRFIAVITSTELEIYRPNHYWSLVHTGNESPEEPIRN